VILPVFIFAEGDTYDVIKENIRDAIYCHFEEDTLVGSETAF